MLGQSCEGKGDKRQHHTMRHGENGVKPGITECSSNFQLWDTTRDIPTMARHE